MTYKKLAIDFEQFEKFNDVINRVIVTDKSTGLKLFAVDYRHSNSKIKFPNVVDGFISGINFFLMEYADVVEVKGCLSEDFLTNNHLLCEAYQSWYPDKYKPYSILPDQVLTRNESHEYKIKRKKSILTFSGGVDACFSLLRHSNSSRILPMNANLGVESVVIVQGFDINYDNNKDFKNFFEHIAPICESFNVDINVVRTNIKELNISNWEHSFGAMTSSILHQFSQEFERGLIGSSESYPYLVNGWGSHPATDYLNSGSLFDIIHDGAGFNRTEKCSFLKNNDVITSRLVVCWENKEQGKNCGFCEKCIRTKINFICCASKIPSCFNNGLTIDQVNNLKFENRAIYNEFLSIIEFCKNNNDYNMPIVQCLENKLNYYKP